MPPRQRTSQFKGTTPTSPTTSVPHAAADQHHHLHHAGPTISARHGVGATSSKPPTVLAQLKSSAEGPLAQRGTHENKPLTEVSPPGTGTSFVKFIYVLLLLMLLFVGGYVSEVVTFLEKLKDEVGLWGIIVGESGGMKRWETLKEWGLGSDRSGGARARKDGDLEDSLNALASALGISPVQVASALKPLIPPASLTSIASKETGGSGAVRILYEDTMRNSQVKPGSTGVAEEFWEVSGEGSDGGQPVEDDMPVV